ncbi:hypothetical protein RB195_002230 [Necator americanus]|uniref:EB module n=1 Tax=Necator americanus TaxID=51031 RepID=A0ABR1DJ14_NECAM
MFVRIVGLLLLLSVFEARHLVIRRGSNAYGDEMVVPSGGVGTGAIQAPAPEQPAAVVVQPPPSVEAKVVESGYLAAYTVVTAFDLKHSSPKAVGPCILNRCPRGFLCSDAECVPNESERISVTEKKKDLRLLESARINPKHQVETLGPCVNSLCPKTYQCNDNTCIRPKPKVRADADPIGPCVNDQCPDYHVCVVGEYKCYPME